ncbi:unnamed protein product, partial [Mesorhabditis belari]|uniref:Transient receptor ion channel domain-containing protein n=1 Tax=Mesorhabditis belari TaxID=2138241 RepID=A0AAF3EAI1_9BILA
MEIVPELSTVENAGCEEEAEEAGKPIELNASMLTSGGGQSGPRRISRGDRSPHVRPRSRNHTLMNNPPPPAVHIRTHDMISPDERRFLEAAERGDKPSIMACLTQRDAGLNVNVLDSMGRSAIEIAVDNENIEIVELLLQQPSIRVGNSLLCAIREGVYRLVEMLVNHHSITKEMLGEGWTQYLDPGEAASAEYSSDISPVILAAQLNQFEILQMLLRKDATIETPHKYNCICESCDRERLNDSLQYSLKRINTYRALASPAWMSLTSPDPIFSAFRLSWELQQLSEIEHEFKDTYLKLAEQCKQFACDLLSQCRSSEEVIAILNKDVATHDENIDVWASKLSLSRLKLAIKYQQKAFVSHPHCQQLLTSIWYEGFPGRQQRGSLWNWLICILLILLWPALAICYILMPKSRVGRIVRSPFMKFLYYSISFGCFLLLLTLATFEDYRSEQLTSNSRASDRGPSATMIETLVVCWVFGMLWSEIKQLWEEGFSKYVYQWWNWLDFIMICLYLCTISLRVSAYFIYHWSKDRFILRTYWDGNEPMLLAEALFAVGNVFSFARIIYLFQTNPYLGPLQISLGCMLVDVAKFCFIFILIISSFSIGLAQLYWYYRLPVCLGDECREDPNVFSSIYDSYLTLLWSVFSITKVEDTTVVEAHHLTQLFGRALFIIYHMTSIIVLLNMLIAMMSSTFQTINDHADLEWKFHRTKLWMAHFDEGSSLPPPFNIVVTPKAILYFLCSFWNTVRWLFGNYQYTKSRSRATIRRPGYSRRQNAREQKKDGLDLDKPLTYADIIQRLVARFIHQTKKDMKMDGVNEDDLLEIKQDISSLRYELRDDRRREIVRSSSHIDAVKRELMRTMSSTTRKPRMTLGVTPEESVVPKRHEFFMLRMWPRSFRHRRPKASVTEEGDGMSDEESTNDSNSLLFTPSGKETFVLPEITKTDLEQGDLLKHPRKQALCKTDTSISYSGASASDPRFSRSMITDRPCAVQLEKSHSVSPKSVLRYRTSKTSSRASSADKAKEIAGDEVKKVDGKDGEAIPPPSTTPQQSITGNHLALDAVQRIRTDLNAKLDQLIAQMTPTASDIMPPRVGFHQI